VHAFETRPVVIWPALAAKKRGAKLFLDWCDWFGRGGSVEERPNFVIRLILRPIETFFENHYRSDADGTTVINTFLYQKAIDLGVSPETIKIIRNGSNLKIQPKNCLEARKMLGLPTNMNLIGFVGGIYQQDAQFMAKAFNHLQKLNPKTRLVLVGYFNRPIEKWIINRNVVIRSGPLESNKLYNYLSACDVCWLPLCDSGANRGRWPYKLNDYMTVARPTIATKVGDLENFIKQYQIGTTTPVDAKEFANQTLDLLQNPSRARVLGDLARNVAETEFNWENLTTELESFYSSIG
jgi:glycosyltransferase involved in cell wall biosynthesis